MRKRTERPRLDYEQSAAALKFSKPQYRQSLEAQIDTTGLTYRKIHPTRDEQYLRWLAFQRCAIEGRRNSRTDIVHQCWSPSQLNGRFTSDAAHPAHSYSGRLKHSDTQCIPLCRHAHREETGNARRFDDDYDICRLELAAIYYSRFKQER